MINYEMQEIFEGELNFINIFTILAIFLVVAITFKSLGSPLILVLMIQCAIYLTMGINYIQGIGIYYLALIIVQALLMGAAIDYGILFTSYYVNYRKTEDMKTSVQKSYEGSMSTILTSSSILIGITLIVGMVMSNETTAQICLTISKGAAMALIQVVLLLPAVLAAADVIVIKKKYR